MANRNRTAGHNYERQVAKELKALGYEKVVTSRSESRNMDNSGVDLFDPTGVFPFYIQNKIYKGYPKLDDLINGKIVKKDKPMLVFHKKVEKKGDRFYTQDEFVSMRKEEFYVILEQLTALRSFKKDGCTCKTNGGNCSCI